MIISYLGKTYKTDTKKDLTQEQYEEIVRDYYLKPQFSEVAKQMQKIDCGGVKINHIYNYYIKDIAVKTRLYHSKWSVAEVLECKELVEVFYGKTENNKKVYPDSLSIAEKIAAAFRLQGKGLAEKPANFPLKTCNNILDKYNVNNKYYDFSCGWGTRLISALSRGIDYYGTDPNYLLCDRLMRLSGDYMDVCGKSQSVDIRKHGSEDYVEEWANTFGLCFSSPPYFNLEDYKIGNQSYKDGMTYKEWLDGYLAPTIRNIYEYLISDGYFLINLKNYKNYHLIEDSIDICKRVGFVFRGTEKLKNNLRVGISDCNTHEDIMVFTKTWN